MRHNKVGVYLHLIWSTWDRVPLISGDLERHLWRAIQHEVEAQGCDLLAIGGVEDHVHLLVTLPPSLCIVELIKRVKGTSSRYANDFFKEHNANMTFKWQASYAVFSVSRWDVKQVKGYILRQKEHHAQGTTKPQLEDFYKPESQDEVP